MAKNIISHYILRLLLTQKRACLPGLGILYLEPASAQILKNHGRILPPTYEVRLAPSDRISGAQLKAQLLRWEQMTDVGADKIVEEYEKVFPDRLLDGAIVIENVGEFKNTEEGIRFDESEDIDAYLSPLPEYDMKPLEVHIDEKRKAAAASQIAGTTSVAATVAAHKHAAARSTEGQSQGPTETEGDGELRKMGFLWILIGLLAILIGLGVYFYFWGSGDSWLFDGNDTAQYSHSIKEKPLNPAPLNCDTSLSIAEKNQMAPSDKEALEKWILDEVKGMDTTNNQSTASSGIKGKTEGKNSTTFIDNDTFDGSQKSQGGKKNNSQDEVITSSANNQAGSQVGNSTSGQSKPTGDCIIIVGAFGEQSNVDRMKGKLEMLGWEVYSNQPYKLTKMGAYVPCDRQGLQAALQELRETVEPKAWIYKGNQNEK